MSTVHRPAGVHVHVSMVQRCTGVQIHVSMVQRPSGVHVQVSMFKGPQVCTGRHKQWEEQELGLDRQVGKR